MTRRRVRGYLRMGASLLAMALVLVALVTYGCGGGGGGGGSTAPAASNPPAPTTATVEFNFNLANRTVPADVTSFRITGYDNQGNLVFGPVDRPKAAQIVLTNVPVQTTSVRVEYLQGATLVGLFASQVSLNPGQTQRFDDPVHEDLPPASLTRVEVDPATASVAAGITTPFTAVAVFQDGFRQVVTGDATWTSGNTATATVSNTAGTKGTARGVAAGQTTVNAAYAGRTGSANLTVTPARLTSLAVTPPNASLPDGRTQQYTATGTFSDQTTADITADVTWSSSNTARATISNTVGSKGLATGVDPGAVTITATHAASGISGSTGLTVTAAELVSVAVTPANPSVAKGRTQQFTATGTFSDSTTRDITTTMNWTSSNTSVASISNLAGTRGLASTHATGQATITATDPTSNIAGNTTLTVTPAVLASINVTPASPTVPKGLTQQFTATGVFTDSTTQDLTTSATWSSSATSIATISNSPGSQGLASTVATGSTTITALDAGSGISGSTVLTVNAAQLVSLAVTPTNPSVAKGRTQQFTATGTYTDSSNRDVTAEVTWTSSQTATATISNAAGTKGLATSVATGSSTITAAASGTAITGTTTLTVTPAVLVSLAVTPTNPNVPKGLTQQFTATGTFSDNTTQNLTTGVTWVSSNTAAATISNVDGSRGLATTVAVGQTTITATDSGTGISGNTTLNVTAAALVSLAVTPANPSVAKGRTQQFTASGTFTDGTQDDLTASVTWTSTNTATASITSNGGLATALATGTTTIRATHAGSGIQGSTTLTVTPAVLVSLAVTPANPSVAKGRTQQFTATGTFSDSSTSNLTNTVTWSSSTTATATISNVDGTRGVATAVAEGSTTITATDSSSGVTNNTTLTVTPAVLVSLAVTPANSTVVQGSTKQFTATGTYSDNTTANLTTQVTWSSSNTGAATISNAGGSQGLATGVAPGQTTITAVDPGTSVSGNTGLTVTEAPAPEITVQFTNKCGGTPIPPEVVGMQVRWTRQDTFAVVTGNLDANGRAVFTRQQITPGVAWDVRLVPASSGCGSVSGRIGCWDGTHAAWGTASSTPTGESNGIVRLYLACPGTCQPVPAPPYGYDAAWGNQASGCSGG